jgi:hypothetical protein
MLSPFACASVYPRDLASILPCALLRASLVAIQFGRLLTAGHKSSPCSRIRGKPLCVGSVSIHGSCSLFLTFSGWCSPYFFPGRSSSAWCHAGCATERRLHVLVHMAGSSRTSLVPTVTVAGTTVSHLCSYATSFPLRGCRVTRTDAPPWRAVRQRGQSGRVVA